RSAISPSPHPSPTRGEGGQVALLCRMLLFGRHSHATQVTTSPRAVSLSLHSPLPCRSTGRGSWRGFLSAHNVAKAKKPPLTPPLLCKGGGLEKTSTGAVSLSLHSPLPCCGTGRGSWRGFLSVRNGGESEETPSNSPFAKQRGRIGVKTPSRPASSLTP